MPRARPDIIEVTQVQIETATRTTMNDFDELIRAIRELSSSSSSNTIAAGELLTTASTLYQALREIFTRSYSRTGTASELERSIRALKEVLEKLKYVISPNGILHQIKRAKTPNITIIRSIKELLTDNSERLAAIINLYRAHSEHQLSPYHPKEISEVNQATRQKKRHPKQVEGPIMTDVIGNVLVPISGRAVQTPSYLEGLVNYLEKQISILINELVSDSNIGSNTGSGYEVAPFKEARVLLQNWSITNLLAFGAHLFLLEHSAVKIKEKTDRHTGRLDSILRNARMFITSFPEWDSHVDSSLRFAVKYEGVGSGIQKISEDAAASLAEEVAHVNQDIPSALHSLNQTALLTDNKIGYATAITSEVRSLRNISASYLKVIYSAMKAGHENLAPGTLAFLRTVCKFHPFILRLASLWPSLAWAQAYGEEMRLFCEGLSKTKEMKLK